MAGLSIGAWWRRWRGERNESAWQTRWVVVDCETSGLDVAKDRVLAIGAVGVRDAAVVLADSFSMLIGQAEPSAAHNILVHGIGGDAQRAGDAPDRVLASFIDYAGEAPIAAFHAPFDRAMLERAARAGGLRWRKRWLDLAGLLPMLFPERGKICRGLDDWLDAFSIAHAARHDALGDAFATAQLLQIALAEARRHRYGTVHELIAAGASAKWVPG